jgi:hypothetical protein
MRIQRRRQFLGRWESEKHGFSTGDGMLGCREGGCDMGASRMAGVSPAIGCEEHKEHVFKTHVPFVPLRTPGAIVQIVPFVPLVGLQ